MTIPSSASSRILTFSVGDRKGWFGTFSVQVIDNGISTTASTIIEPISPPNYPAIIGGSVGALLLLLLVLFVIFAILALKKRPSSRLQVVLSDGGPISSSPSPSASHSSPITIPIERPATVNLSKSDLDYRDFTNMTQIGKGSFGVVFKATWRETTVAVKQLHADLLLDEKAITDFKSEAQILSSLRPHPNVILFIGVTAPPQPTTIVTEFCGAGSLYSLLHSNREISPETQHKILLGIARGMYHLHSENIIHRDLAARNILLTKNLDVKVSDFGMSRQKFGSNDNQKTYSSVGPLRWMAPEAIGEKVYSFKSDVYSFSITMWEILARATPYPELDPVSVGMQVWYEGLRPSIPEHSNETYLLLMQQCWATKPEERPSFKDICAILQSPSKFAEIQAEIMEKKQNVPIGGGGSSSNEMKNSQKQEGSFLTYAPIDLKNPTEKKQEKVSDNYVEVSVSVNHE